MITTHFRTMLTTHLLLLITFVFGDGTSQVHAEVYAAPGDFGWRKSVPLHVIVDTATVSDLGLNPEVAGKIKNLQNQIQKELEEELAQAYSKANPKPIVQIISRNPEILHTIRNKHAEEINALLTPDQQTRLHQIHLQNPALPSDARLFGLSQTVEKDETDALSDSAVAKELGLSVTQRKEISAIHSAITRAEGLLVKRGKQEGPHYRDLMQESPVKIMNVLTSEQRDAFRKMMGRPLKIYPTKQNPLR